jgi:hypothetical protein
MHLPFCFHAATGTRCSILSNKNPHPLRRWGFSVSGDTPTLEHGTQLAGLTFYQPGWNASGKTKKIRLGV